MNVFEVVGVGMMLYIVSGTIGLAAGYCLNAVRRRRNQ